MSDNGVHVLTILGREYTIKASASEEDRLQQAAALLQARLDESHQRFPGAGSHELLVLTALNLCVPLLRQDEQLEAVQSRLAACAERIGEQLRR